MDKTPYDLALALADAAREVARIRQRLYTYLFGPCDLQGKLAEQICDGYYNAVSESQGFTPTQATRINTRLALLNEAIERRHHLARNGLPER